MKISVYFKDYFEYWTHCSAFNRKTKTSISLISFSSKYY